MTVTPKSRISEFKGEGFEERSKALYCTYCDAPVDYHKKSKIDAHINNIKHKRIKASQSALEKKQQKIDIAFKSDSQWEDLIIAITSMGFPLHILRKDSKVREWIKKYSKNGEGIPSETGLRLMLNKIGEMDCSNSTNALKNKLVCLMSDESIDIKGRKILNILAKPLEQNTKFILIESIVIPECNAIVVANKIDDALVNHGIYKENVVCFVSDNVKYMNLAGSTLKGLCPRLMHSGCWAHILHLQSEELRNKYELADKFIASMKACLVKSPNRKHELLKILKDQNLEEKLPPTPVITRWTTWLAAAYYHNENSEAVKKFIEDSAENSAAITNLKQLIKNEQMWQELERMASVFPGIKKAITSLEDDKEPACYIWSRLVVISTLLKDHGLESEKLDKYLNEKHPAREFWQEVESLDPRKATKMKNILPQCLLNFSSKPVPIEEITMYKIEAENATHIQSPFKFWNDFSKELPILSKLALSALSVPPSSASVERSFSQLKRILTPLRTSLTEENLSVHLKISYNNLDFSDLTNFDNEIDDCMEID